MKKLLPTHFKNKREIQKLLGAFSTIVGFSMMGITANAGRTTTCVAPPPNTYDESTIVACRQVAPCSGSCTQSRIQRFGNCTGPYSLMQYCTVTYIWMNTESAQGICQDQGAGQSTAKCFCEMAGALWVPSRVGAYAEGCKNESRF